MRIVGIGINSKRMVGGYSMRGTVEGKQEVGDNRAGYTDDACKGPGGGRPSMRRERVDVLDPREAVETIHSQQEYAESIHEKARQRAAHETWATSITLLQVPHLPLLLPLLLLPVFVELPLVPRVLSSRSLCKSMKLLSGNHSDVVEGPPFREAEVGGFREEALRAVVVVRCFRALDEPSPAESSPPRVCNFVRE